MLLKFISIKNVGRFRNSAASPNPQLSKHTFITGANGFGKTTICAVLRSLHTGDSDHIIGRKTLGVSDDSTVDLLFDNGPIRSMVPHGTRSGPLSASLMAFSSAKTFMLERSSISRRSAISIE